MIAGIKNQDCLENDIYPATDTYISVEPIYTHCLGNDIMVFKQENIPWNKGKKGLQKAWNKGVKHSPETIEKMKQAITEEWRQHAKEMGKANKGRTQSEETRLKKSTATSGEHNPNFGKHHSEETKEKMRQARLGKPAWNKGKPQSEEHRQKNSDVHNGLQAGKKHPLWGKHHSEETRLKMSLAKIGDKAPLWIDGRSFEPYCPKFNRRLKEQIRDRDNRTCQLCGVQENGKRLHVHHCHYDKENCNPDLIALCYKCHSKVNFNRDFYEKLFITNLKNRGLLLPEM